MKKGNDVYAAKEDKWRAESDARTLQSAEEIKGDKPRYAAAIKCLKEDAEEIESLLKVHGGLRK